MLAIKIILGTTRPGRFGIQPAKWLLNYASSKYADQATFELVDLQEIDLPLFDEPGMPAERNYIKDHTKRFSAAVESADGFVMITPEYNHAPSAVLKNAIDYLYHEWAYKPVAFLSYGGLAGGSRAVEIMRLVVAEPRMFDIYEQILIPNIWAGMNEKGEYQFTQRHEHQADSMLKELLFTAHHMKAMRASKK
jgi:NAD(P)H-dependent FMN reductase